MTSAKKISLPLLAGRKRRSSLSHESSSEAKIRTLRQDQTTGQHVQAVRIFDLQGHCLMSVQGGDQDFTHLNTESLLPGLYLVVIETASTRIQLKALKLP